MYAQSKNGLGEWDFGSIVDTLAKGYSSYSTTKAQADVLKQQAELAAQQAKLAQERAQADLMMRYNPQYSALYTSGNAASGGVTSGSLSNMLPLLLIGGLAIAAFLILRK